MVRCSEVSLIDDRNNGFLRYYTLTQTPNFLLALPMTTLSILAIYRYYQHDPIRFWSLGLSTSSSSSSSSFAWSGKPTSSVTFLEHAKLLPWMYLWAVMVVYCLVFMHVQVMTRFLTSMPALLWFLADLILRQDKRDQWVAYGALSYFVVYGLCGVALFANFYPPA